MFDNFDYLSVMSYEKERIGINYKQNYLINTKASKGQQSNRLYENDLEASSSDIHEGCDSDEKA